jgi:hypothetical protein
LLSWYSGLPVKVKIIFGSAGFTQKKIFFLEEKHI